MESIIESSMEQAMLYRASILAVMLAMPTVVIAEETHSRSTDSAKDSSYYPAYKDGNFSAGGYSSTNTTGGYSEGGSGQAIPNNTRGSSQDTSRGVGIQYNFR